jgi:hypothetical protein
MTNFKLFLVVALAITFVSGCTDYIEEPSPEQSLPSSAAFALASDLESALTGAYDALQQSDMAGTGTAINANVLSDNAQWNGSFPSYIDMFNRQLESANGEVAGMWRFGYLAINQANLVIRGVDESEDPELTQEISDRLRGEALFIRGMVHFEMVRYYGKPYGASSGTDLGIPVMNSAVLLSTEITFPIRNSVEEVYTQAISDLEMARDLLSATSDYGKANATAATAYLAEIAFQQRDYGTAATLAGDVIGVADYSLTASPEEPFTGEGSSEEIFAIVSTIQDNPGVNGSLATFHHINGRGGDVVVSEDLLENGFNAVIPASQQAAAGGNLVDLRDSLLTSSAAAGIVNVEKYEDFTNNADDNILLRLPTFMLMRAEALAREDGINTESINLLNQVHLRSIRVDNGDDGFGDAADFATFTAADFSSPEELIEAIILERRVELAFEGNRLHDLRRLMRDVRGVAYDADVLLFPIPQREMDANSRMVQNPGY